MIGRESSRALQDRTALRFRRKRSAWNTNRYGGILDVSRFLTLTFSETLNGWLVDFTSRNGIGIKLYGLGFSSRSASGPTNHSGALAVGGKNILIELVEYGSWSDACSLANLVSLLILC